jgi:hypothetical protein
MREEAVGRSALPDPDLGLHTFCQKSRQVGKNKIVMQMAEAVPLLSVLGAYFGEGDNRWLHGIAAAWLDATDC